MTAITATEFTTTVSERWIEGKKRHSRCTLTLGTGGNEYGSGIPLPTGTTFGMTRNLDYIEFYSNSHADGYVWKYNATGQTLRGYQTASQILTATQDGAAAALIELATGTTLTTRTWYCIAVGW